MDYMKIICCPLVSNLVLWFIFAVKYLLFCTDKFIFLVAGYFYFMLNSMDNYRAAICGIVWKYLNHFILESHIFIFSAAISCNSVMKWIYSSHCFELASILQRFLSRKSLIIVAHYFPCFTLFIFLKETSDY